MDNEEVKNVHLDPNTNQEIQHKLPLGVLRQAIMKMESAMVDVLEAKEDDDLSDENKHVMEGIGEILGQCVAVIVNITNEEIGEEEFLREMIDMDEIDPFPGTEKNENIMEMEI